MRGNLSLLVGARTRTPLSLKSVTCTDIEKQSFQDGFNGKLEPKLTVALFGCNFGRTGLESIVWSGDLCGHQSHRAPCFLRILDPAERL